MPAHKYVEESGLVAILVMKRSAGVTPLVNLRECDTLPSSMNKAAQRRHHQKSKTEVSVAPQKILMASKILKKRKKSFWSFFTIFICICFTPNYVILVLSS